MTMSLQRFTRKPAVTLGSDASARQAAELMRERHVGAIIVVEANRPVGMITDRDLALRVVGDHRDANTRLAEVMSHRPVALHESDSIDQALFTMRREGVRRLPILDDREGAIVGLVSIDDLLVLLAGELSSTAEAIIDNRGP
jgi:CBS domain-containing protein